MKVVNWNLANYDDHPNWEQRLQMIADNLIILQPDLVALQEIRFNPDQVSTRVSYQNMAEQVLHAIRQIENGDVWAGTSIVTQTSMFYPLVGGEENPWRYPQPSPNEKEWEGLTILSRGGVLETGSVFLSLSNCTDFNRRITQYVAVDSLDGLDDRLFLFNAHFSYSGACRVNNVNETLAYMSRYDGYQLLVGDMNATPDDPSLQPLRDAGLVDLWQELQGDALGYTAPSDDPTNRIDYCWANQALAALATEIELIATQPEDDVYASDHFGLCVTFDS